MVSMWADKAFFQASVPVIFGAEGFNVPEAFKQDRAQMSGRPFDTDQMRATAPMMRDQWRGHAAWVEEALAGGKAYLFGDQPGLGDIAAHMNFWFLRNAYRPGYDGLMASYRKTVAWVERVSAIGHGTSENISSNEALTIATSAAATPRSGIDPQEPQGLREGDYIAIAPDDYGRDPVSGTLTYSDAVEIAIRREVAGLGEVVVHFPRVGFTARRS